MDDTQSLKQLRDQERAARLLLLELAQKRREIMKRLHDGGMKYQQIADIYGVKDGRRVEWIVKGRKAKGKYQPE